MVSTTEAAATRRVSIRPVQGVVSVEPGQSFHQNATMATAGSANAEIGPRISSDVSVLPVPRASAKKTTAPSSSPPTPSQGCAARRWPCRSADAWRCMWGGVVSSGRMGSGSVPPRLSRRLAGAAWYPAVDRGTGALAVAAAGSAVRCASRCSMAMGSSRTRYPVAW